MAKPYQMMLKLKLADGASKGLLEIAKALRQIDDDAVKAQHSLSLLEQHLLKLKDEDKGKDKEKEKDKVKDKGRGKDAGKDLAGIGTSMLGALKSPYEAAAEVVQARTDFETLNLDAQSNAAVYAKAAALSQQMLGAGIADNVARMRELNEAFGSLPRSLALSGDFAQYAFAAKAANGGKDVEGQTANAAQALALRGAQVSGSESALRDELSMQSQVYFASGGKVNGAEFAAAAKSGKQAYQHFDKEYLYGRFSAYMAQESGETAGANAQGAYATLVGGAMDSKTSAFMSKLGLLEAHGKGGKPTLSAANIGLMKHRPDLLMDNVLAPAIQKKYGKLDDGKMLSLLQDNLDQPTASFLGDQMVNRPRLQAQAQAYRQASNYGSAYQQYLKSPKGAEMAAAQAWKNLLTVIGSVYLPRVTGALLSFARTMDQLGNWMGRYPALTQVLVYSFGLLGGALAIGGTVVKLAGAMEGVGTAALWIVRMVPMAWGALATLCEVLLGLLGPVGLAVAAIAALGGIFLLFHESAPKPAPAVPAAAGMKGLAAAQQPLSPGVPYPTFSPVPPPAPVPVFKVENKFDHRGITTRILQEAGARMARPPTGPQHFDGAMDRASVAYAG
ncbi:hypothetical protein GTP91_20505 [Rugamonas sp. FT82W]|uniref:Uncharacterized protein n=1 Tax=Duganella vulcania TaxID=2692166 RepID=A0A845G8M9_9BURK|nr:hypothetical protein [Duganella vulcania]MYM89546.1 hypothetical protein [Duganella vulcania]